MKLVTFLELSRTLNLSNNDFIRTTEKRHHVSVQIFGIFRGKRRNLLSKYSGWYSVSDEAFYQEDEIEEKNDSKHAISSGSLLNG